jgi:Flp pilus assembly protein TadB
MARHGTRAVLAGAVLAGAVLAGPVLAGAVLAGPVLAGAGPAGAGTARLDTQAPARPGAARSPGRPAAAPLTMLGTGSKGGRPAGAAADRRADRRARRAAARQRASQRARWWTARRALAALPAAAGRTASPARGGNQVPRGSQAPPASRQVPAQDHAPGRASLRATLSRVLHRAGFLLAGLAGLFGALLLLALAVASGARRGGQRRELVEQLARYRPWQHAVTAGATAPSRQPGGWLARLPGSGRAEQRLAERLDLAGISRSPTGWVVIAASCGVALAVLITLATGSVVLGLLAGALVGWAGQRATLAARTARRRAAFAEQLPDLLQLVAGALQAGFSLAQALDVAVREGSQPAAGEFARALGQTRIGVELTAALDQVADRMSSEDLRWTVMAVQIQREVGGNLAEVLLTTVTTMRDRAQLRRHVRALSAEGRLSAYILIALPVLIAGWLFITAPSYMRPLYTTPIGLAMLALAAGLVVAGGFWMRKVIKVEM